MGLQNLVRYLQRPAVFAIAVGIGASLSLVGCGVAHPPLPAFEDPNALGERAMGRLDSNKDGLLQATELQSAGGLAASLDRLDTNDDDKLSRHELQDRLEALAVMSDVLAPTIFVFQSGKAVADAAVEFRPDSWQADHLTTLRGVTDSRGRCILKPERGDLPGIPKGFYTVFITPSGSTNPIERGCEIADDVNSREVQFDLSETARER